MAATQIHTANAAKLDGGSLLSRLNILAKANSETFSFRKFSFSKSGI